MAKSNRRGERTRHDAETVVGFGTAVLGAFVAGRGGGDRKAGRVRRGQGGA